MTNLFKIDGAAKKEKESLLPLQHDEATHYYRPQLAEVQESSTMPYTNGCPDG